MERAGFPYFEVLFDLGWEKDPNAARARLAGTEPAPVPPALPSRADRDRIVAQLKAAGVTDLIVMSHGWKNTLDVATDLYGAWLTSARAVLDAGAVSLGARRVGFLGVFWPAAKFADAWDKPGGAAGLDDEAADRFEALYGAEARRTLESKLENEGQDACVEYVKALIGPALDEEDAAFHGAATTELLAAGNGAAVGWADDGGAADLGAVLHAMQRGVRALLNNATYYGMKRRAGTMGALGLHAVLTSLKAELPALKLHLVGHSFGGRLVTACIDGEGHASTLEVDSLTLLQAAFSHNGFRAPEGYFRAVPTRVRGPILITHTKNDTAVGIAYPLASRLSNDGAAALGDANDHFGGMGRNGAQGVAVAPPAVLAPLGQPSAYTPGKIHNLEASAFIHDHNDVTGREVAQATLTAIAVT